MKKFGIGILVLAAAALLLYLTKPNEENFREWINQDWVKQELRNTANISDLIKEDFKVEPSTKLVYEDNYIYSNVYIKIANKDRRFLGIMGNWIYND